MNNIAITTECVADLPQHVYSEKDIRIIYYDIKTEEGIFRDTKEIDSQNVIEYMSGGKKHIYSVVPSANDFKYFFSKMLKEYDEIIHICISAGVSEAVGNAQLAKVKMGRDGDKIHIVDSRHLSSGQGLIVLEAVRLKESGLECDEIIKSLLKFIPRVSTSFLSDNANYLYYNGKVGKRIMGICDLFRIHPVLALIDGKMIVKRVYIGDYHKAAKRYIRKVLKNANKIDKTRGFITYAGCTEKLLSEVNEEVSKCITFDSLDEQKASATVSSNCGPGTFGIIYSRREE